MSDTPVRKRKSNFALLNREVIKPGYCTSCGGCEAVCPIFVISMEQLKPNKLLIDSIKLMNEKVSQYHPNHPDKDYETIAKCVSYIIFNDRFLVESVSAYINLQLQCMVINKTPELLQDMLDLSMKYGK